METKHTPAPWIISELNDAINGEENIMIEHEGCPLCEVRGTNDMSCIDEDDLLTINGEIIANARLIAAAPELLEACMNLENDDGAIPKHAWDLIQKAIKSATQ